jgi:hypothetical protein
MLRAVIRVTENLAVLSLLTASSVALHLGAARARRRARAELLTAWPGGAALE